MRHVRIGIHRWPQHMRIRLPDHLQPRSGNTDLGLSITWRLWKQTDATSPILHLPSLRPTTDSLHPSLRPRLAASTPPLLPARETPTPPCVTSSIPHRPAFRPRAPLFGGETSSPGWTKNMPSRYAPSWVGILSAFAFHARPRTLSPGNRQTIQATAS